MDRLGGNQFLSFLLVETAIAAAGGGSRIRTRLYQTQAAGPPPRECKGNRFEAANMPLSFLTQWSYGIHDSRIVGLPEWATGWELTYDFEATAAAPMNLEQRKLTFRTLLADRFKMSAHRESRKDASLCALVVGRNGPKLRPEGEGGRIHGSPFQTLSDAETPKGLPMHRLVSILNDISEIGLPVVDRTGLSEACSFHLTYSIKEGADPPEIYTATQGTA